MRFDGGEWLGVSWERHSWGVECSAMSRDMWGPRRVSRKYVGNGSDRVTVRGSVLAFRRDVLGLSRGAA